MLSGYCIGYSRRLPRLAVLVVENDRHALEALVRRFQLRFSFAVAALPEHAVSATAMFEFDAIVVPRAIADRELLVAQLGASRVYESADPIVVARELRAGAVRAAVA
jgi:hypothetical protein